MQLSVPGFLFFLPFPTTRFFYSRSVPSGFLNFLFMDSAPSSFLSPCVLLSEGAALTMALHLGKWPCKAIVCFPFCLVLLVSHTRAY